MNDILKNKKIVLGVTGSIAAYKAPLVVRELVKRGAEVKVIMTPHSKYFVAPVALASVSRNAVVSDMFDLDVQRGGAWHIELAHWCDAMMIAPCSASTMGKIVSGICDNALVSIATALPRVKPFVVAPAMDTDMWLHPATQSNVQKLREFGATIIPPAEGELASGLIGPGRMPEPVEIADALGNVLAGLPIADAPKPSAFEVSSKPLAEAVSEDKFKAELELAQLKRNIKESRSPGYSLSGKKILITAGPTYEPIDSVRYIANHSSGKMGFALAEEAALEGAKVTLVAGPVALQTPEGVERVDVVTAEEMYRESVARFPETDIAILAAAVADFTPKSPVEGKIKKSEAGSGLTLEMTATKDILAKVSSLKTEKQKVIGFALEATNELEYGRAKLAQKKCDMIVINSAIGERSGFAGDDNTITIIASNGFENSYPPMPKPMCAQVILKHITELLR
ncbi:MAG: bifunctional phosphopantothenoylcysteine decarboxylase/phosphopantothenate synthase [Chloroflexota bacterium]